MEAKADDNNVEIWRMRKMIRKLRHAKGKQGGSMISMLLPGKKAIAEYTKKLADEIGKANNIQDRVNR